MQQNVHVTSIVVLMSSLVIHGALQNCVVILGYLLEYATEKKRRLMKNSNRILEFVGS